MTGMNHRMQRMGISASDLSDAVRMIRRLCLPSTHGQSRMDALIHEMSRIMEAECACVYESRGRFAGVMTELYRHQWRDWQTEALAESMNGRRLSDITQACTYMVWNAPSSADSKGQPCWYCVASCLPAGANYFLTLAFARRAHPFSEREATLMRSLHEAGAFELFAQHRVDHSGRSLSPRSREVLSGLLRGQSEKEVAIELGVSRHTVHAYVKSLYRRYSVRTRGELMSISIDPFAKLLLAR